MVGTKTAGQDSLVKQASFSVIGVAAQGGARFVTTIIVGRVVGVDALAGFSAALAITIIAALIFPTGLGFAVSRALSHASASERREHIVRASLTMLLSTALVLTAAAGLVQWAIEPSDLVTAFSVGALTFAYSAYVVTRSIQFALGLGQRAATWDVLAAVVSLGGVFVLAANGASSLLLVPMTIGFVACVAQAVLTEWTGGSAAVDLQIRGALIRSAAWNSASVVSTNALIQVAMVVVFVADISSTAGLFAAALAIATATTMAAQAVSQALLPRITRWTSIDQRSGYAAAIRALGALILLCILGYALLALLAEPILILVYGVPFIDATGMLQVLSIAMCLFSIGVLASAFLIAVGKERTVTIASGIGLVSGVLAGTLASITDGLITAALVSIVLSSFVSCIAVFTGVIRAVRQGFHTVR